MIRVMWFYGIAAVIIGMLAVVSHSAHAWVGDVTYKPSSCMDEAGCQDCLMTTSTQVGCASGYSCWVFQGDPNNNFFATCVLDDNGLNPTCTEHPTDVHGTCTGTAWFCNCVIGNPDGTGSCRAICACGDPGGQPVVLENDGYCTS